MLTFIGGVDEEDNKEDETAPSIARIGMFPFLRYALCGILLQCTVFYLLETFSFFSIADTLINIAGSTLFSLLIIWFIDSIRGNN